MGEELQTYAGLGSVVVITALVEVIKPWLPDTRWYSPLAIILGLVWNLTLVYSTVGSWQLAVVYGIVAGLAASGLYSAAGALRGGGR